MILSERRGGSEAEAAITANVVFVFLSPTKTLLNAFLQRARKSRAICISE